MTITKDQLTELVADVLGEQFASLRAQMFERLLDIEARSRRPNFQLTAKGELYCDGKVIGDVRPIFKQVVADVLAERDAPKE